MKTIPYKILFVFVLLWANGLFSQYNVGITARVNPNSGCNLTNSEEIKVVIASSSLSISAGQTKVSYSINGSTMATEFPGSIPASPSTSIYTFTQKADLSACDSTFNIKVWIETVSPYTDLDHSNDTLTFSIRNDCTITPGVINSDITVCKGANSGALNLSGWQHGTITDWMSSTDGGSTWNSIPGSAGQTSYNYSNVSTDTKYKVNFEGGFCPDAVTPLTTITVQNPPVGGVLSGPDSLCISSGSGTINLASNVGSVLDWENSLDSLSWMSLGNMTNSYNFSSLTQTTAYRAKIDGGVCADIYSDTIGVVISNLSTVGTLSRDSVFCNNGQLHLGLDTYSGNLLTWQNSIDNSTWSVISNGMPQVDSLNTGNLSSSKYFRVAVKNGVCPAVISNSVFIKIENPIIPGTISGGGSFCVSNVNGTLNLSGNTGTVQNWEQSIDSGSTWTNISNTTTTENYSGLTQTTWYRAQIDGGTCGNLYSDTAIVGVSQLSNSGILSIFKDSICRGESDTLYLNSYLGNIAGLQSSSDSISWTIMGVTDTVYAIPNSTQFSTYYRAIVKNGDCAADTSNVIYLHIDNVPVGGNISGGGTYCVSNATGALTLSGNSNNVLNWEQSLDSGVTWTNVVNTTTNENFNGLTQSTYYRAVVDGGLCGNIYTDTAKVIISQLSSAGILKSDTAVCQGEAVNLTIGGSIVGNVDDWQISTNGVIWNSLGVTDSSYNISSLQDSSYFRVIVTNGICSADTSNQVLVSAIPLPIANAGPDEVIMMGDSVQLNGSGGIFGQWLPNPSLSDTSIYNPIAKPTATTTYTLYVINAQGCFNADKVTVTVGTPASLLDVKNVITANSDGYNDTWIIDGIQYFSKVSVKVYNIYGNLVYQNDQYQNDWKGDYKGKMLPDGTYLYIVIPEGADTVLKGNLTIMGQN